MSTQTTQRRSGLAIVGRPFRQLLANTLMTGVTSTFLWFALTFWVYLETRSVVTTGVVGGAFSLSSALLGPVFGTFVDRHRKKTVLVVATIASLACFAAAAGVYAALAGEQDLLRLGNAWFWVLVITTLLGSVAGQMRGIALSTCVTLLVPEDARDRANGLVGTITGVSFAVTSVFSGLVIGTLGMGWAYGASVVLVLAALAHLAVIRIPEDKPAPAEPERGGILAGGVGAAVEAIRAVPGLSMLIGLAAFNNLLAGVFMVLVDPYGLTLVSVETWGALWGVISLAFIAGGVVVARRGLGPKPLRVVLAGNLVNWLACSVFGLRSSIVLLTIAMIVWLGLIPAIEAAEQTILQRNVPFERQGRVFGLAQLLENAASPITAFLMAPLAQAVFIPFMTSGRGATWIGGWFGTGADRGMALMFTLAGVIGVVATVIAWTSKSYRRLNGAAETPAPSAPALVPIDAAECAPA